jgi:hypothetical protein
MFIVQAKRKQRQLFEPLGIQCRAVSAARRMGWNGKESLVWCDYDGEPLGGFVPAR